jgi:dTDP-glucose pyrophosphorylase/predicted transcriptional regulator
MELDLYTIPSNTKFHQAISEMDARGKQILLVVDDERRLIGTVTDGDLRRGYLKKSPPDTPILEILNSNPIKVDETASVSEIRQLMILKGIHHIPIVDSVGVLTGLHTADAVVSSRPLQLSAILMVGGLGKRLGELTSNCPKPMLEMGGKPILQTIVEQLRVAGVTRIYMAVNYLGDQIKQHFGDGSSFGVSVRYLEEHAPLGTAGALRLLEGIGDDPLLVMNGDILTKVNYSHILSFHNTHKAVATMCVREFGYQLPYGVVELDGIHIKKIDEKPATVVFVNSGIYVLDPSALGLIPESGPYQMPELFSILRDTGRKTVAYPIIEYWKDIGSPEDFKEAEGEFESTFMPSL